MQYFKPADPYFVGDCMPFFHDGVFHLFWLLDENHHQAKSGLGGHQWAHATSTDLRHWQHHPLALAIDDAAEASICTGSVFYHEGVFYAYYATRRPDGTEHLSLATGRDGVTFQKVQPNPFLSPPAGYVPKHWRDPHVFRDEETGLFRLLVTACLEDYALAGRGGCLAHFTSRDLGHWQLQAPFIIPGELGVPECPDYFRWGDWYYLLFSLDGVARYRLSRGPLGPWRRPRVDTFDGRLARVLKTAAFTGDRRLGVAFVPTRQGDRDDGPDQYAGNALFRELVQHADGSLGCRFPAEMVPAGGAPLALRVTALTGQVTGGPHRLRLAAEAGIAVATCAGLPPDFRLSARVRPEGAAAFGLRLRGAEAFRNGYDLAFHPAEGRVTLHQAGLSAVEGLERPFTLDVVCRGDMIDACIDGRRCLVNRLPELRGDRLSFFCWDGAVSFEQIKVSPLHE